MSTIEKNSSLKGQVNVVMTDAGIELRFGSNLLFPAGKAALRPEGYDAIFSIGKILGYFVKARNAFISVEGHTDDTPLRSTVEFNPTGNCRLHGRPRLFTICRTRFRLKGNAFRAQDLPTLVRRIKKKTLLPGSSLKKREMIIDALSFGYTITATCSA